MMLTHSDNTHRSLDPLDVLIAVALAAVMTALLWVISLRLGGYVGVPHFLGIATAYLVGVRAQLRDGAEANTRMQRLKVWLKHLPLVLALAGAVYLAGLYAVGYF